MLRSDKTHATVCTLQHDLFLVEMVEEGRWRSVKVGGGCGVVGWSGMRVIGWEKWKGFGQLTKTVDQLSVIVSLKCYFEFGLKE